MPADAGLRAPAARPRSAVLSLGAAVLALAALAFLGPGCGKPAPGAAGNGLPLYTGKEAKRKVDITFPSGKAPGFVTVEREIYATASSVNQGKQLLLALMAGPQPQEDQAAACFGPQASFLELYLDGKGLAVVDLPKATVDGLPGGTSAEVATLYCLIRTLSQGLPGVTRVQVLIDGQVPETLRGHMDVSDPLSLSDL